MFKDKLEERYKEKNKEVKELKRQKDIVDAFIKQILGKINGVYSAEGKLEMELEALLKNHHEIYST